MIGGGDVINHLAAVLFKLFQKGQSAIKMLYVDPCHIDEYSFTEDDLKAFQKKREVSVFKANKTATALTKLYIEPTSKCNLACTMCFRKTWIDEEFADMELVVFDRIINTLPESVKIIFFGGMGEPLFHKDIIYMVQKASGTGRRVELLTNGTLLSQDMVTNLLDAGLDMLWVSIDSFDTQSYENIRQHSSFSLIKKNIGIFNTERQRRERDIQLGLAFVAMKSNIGQLEQLAQFAQDNNVRKVNISNVIPTDSASIKESLYTRIIHMELNSENAVAAYPEIDMPFMDFQIDDARKGFTGLLRSKCNLLLSGEPVMRKKRYCRFIAEGNAFVRHDGDVSPCMALLHSGVTYLGGNKRTIYHQSYGNIKHQRLEEIWQSKDYTEFRNRVLDFTFSPCIQCGGCEFRDDNRADCLGNPQPTCGACLWSEGIFTCP